MSTIDCNDWCKDKLKILHDLQAKKRPFDKIQNATTEHLVCMMDCDNRNRHRASASGGKRKKYINKTKHRRSSTRSRVHHRRSRTHMNHRKKN